MKQKFYQVFFQATVVTAMVAFLSVVFLANADSSFAATTKKKAPVAARITAVEHTEARIKELQAALNFTGPQELLWNNLTQVMRQNAQEMDALNKERAETTKEMNALEQMKFHTQKTEAHLDQMKKILPPFEALYTSMSDEQKKITDTIFKTGRHGKQKAK